MNSFLLFLEAIPKLVSAVELLASEVNKLRERRVDIKIEAAKAEINEVIANIKSTEDRDALLKLVKRLNDSIRL